MKQISSMSLKDLFDKGYSYITLPNGIVKKIIKKDILFKASEIHELERKIKNGEINIK
jgi:hypothetical protein